MRGYVYLQGLRAARVELGMRSADLADMLHVRRDSFRRYETCERRAYRGLVPEIAKILGCTEEYIVNYREVPVKVKALKEPRGRPEGSGKEQPTFLESGKDYEPRQDHIVWADMHRRRRENDRVACPAQGCTTKARRTSPFHPYCERHSSYAVGRTE